jgi:cytoskeletal protein RodZ
MSEELKRLGSLLQAKRKEMNLSLKEVENATSIRSNYLEAIEDGNVNDFIAGVYAQGFIKQYGSFLGMDPDRLVKDFPMISRMPGEKHDFAYGIGTLEMRGAQGGGVKWLPNLIWAGAAATILVGAWFFAKFVGLI